MMKLLTRMLAPLAAVALTACAVGDLPYTEGTEDGPALAISVSELESTDTEFMRFRLYQCGGVDPVMEQTRAYEPLRLPGGIEAFEGRPYDASSAHIFADQYFLVDAGCYDVEVIPMDENMGQSADCGPATKPNVYVEDGKTTEVLLISQCLGAQRGGLDVVGSLNRPPYFNSLTFDPSKFVACPQEVNICVDVNDPDGDPMVLEWNILDGPTPVTTPVVSSSTQSGGWIQECLSFEPGAGVWEIEVKAFDQAYYHGNKITFSDLYALTGRLDSSEDVLRFPLYGGGAECAACDCKEAVSNLSYDIDRNGQQLNVTSLSQIQPGDVVTPNFDIAPGCGPIELSFASYETSGPNFATSFPQTTYEWSTGYFADGNQSLAPVGIPACYFQADMVCGAVLYGDELNRGARYGDRKLDWVNGGTTACNPVDGCTRTRGYWTTHNEFAFAPGLKVDWPAPYDEHDLLCGEKWLEVIDASKRPQTRYYQLAAQWIAATLNGANGADTTAAATDLASAESMLLANCATQTIPAADDATAEQLKDALDAYNNGLTGPPKCE